MIVHETATHQNTDEFKLLQVPLRPESITLRKSCKLQMLLIVALFSERSLKTLYLSKIAKNHLSNLTVFNYDIKAQGFIICLPLCCKYQTCQ